MSAPTNRFHFSQANMAQMGDCLIQNKFVKKVRRRDDQHIIEVMLLTKGEKIGFFYPTFFF